MAQEENNHFYNIMLTIKCSICHKVIIDRAVHNDNEDNNPPGLLQSKIDLHGITHKGEEYNIDAHFTELFGSRMRLRRN